jgi:hypothetical protein
VTCWLTLGAPIGILLASTEGSWFMEFLRELSEAELELVAGGAGAAAAAGGTTAAGAAASVGQAVMAPFWFRFPAS